MKVEIYMLMMEQYEKYFCSEWIEAQTARKKHSHVFGGYSVPEYLRASKYYEKL